MASSNLVQKITSRKYKTIKLCTLHKKTANFFKLKRVMHIKLNINSISFIKLFSDLTYRSFKLNALEPTGLNYNTGKYLDIDPK